MRCLREDVTLQLAQGRPRIDAQVFGQPRPGPAQNRERVALAPGLVQRQREQPPCLLPQRLLCGQAVQVGDCLRRVTQAQRRLRA